MTLHSAETFEEPLNPYVADFEPNPGAAAFLPTNASVRQEFPQFETTSFAVPEPKGPAFEPGKQDGTLLVHPKTPFPQRMLALKDTLESGFVRHLHVEKQFGFIFTSAAASSSEDVFFYFNKVKNVTEHALTLGPGSELQFSRDGLTKDGKFSHCGIATMYGPLQ